MSVFYDLNKTPRNILNQAIVRAIVSENNGALFDTSDLSTLYQDAAGTIPVTAVEQPVGLHLDKSRGLQLGNEIVPDPTFSQWTDPSVPDGWIKTGTHNASNYVQESSSALRLVSDGTYIGVTTTSALTIGKTYRVKFDIVSSTMGSVAVLLGAGTDLIRSAPGSYSATIKATGTTIDVKRNAGSAVDIVVDNLSVRELPGYHATQPITASRPTLSARYNMLNKTEDFADVAWGKYNQGLGTLPIVTNNYGIAPDGAQTAARVQMALNSGTTNSDRSDVYNSALPTLVGSPYVIDVWLKTNDGSTKQVQLNFNFYGGGSQTITGSWQKFSVSITSATDASRVFRLGLRGGYSTSDSADILVWHPQQALGTTAGPYQRVNTATDYDTDTRYFPAYLRFDGVDDYLNLPYMGLYANGSASVVINRSKIPASVVGYSITETSSITDAPVYSFGIGGGALMREGALIRNDASSIIVDTRSDSSLVESATSFISSFIDDGTSVKRYLNSKNATTTPAARSGSLTLNRTTIGALSRTSITGYLPDNLYGLIITKAALTDSQRVACERYLGRKSGVQL